MRLRVALAAMAATLAALPLLHPLFDQPSWIALPALAVVLVALAGVAGRAARVPAALIPLLQVLVVTCLAAARFAPAAALAGFVPTPEAVAVLAATTQEGMDDIYVNPSPVSLTPGVGLIILLSIGAVAVAVDLAAVTLRAPVLAGIPLLGVFAIPLAVHHEGIGWLAFSIAALGFLLLLAVDGWDRTTRWGAPVEDPRGRSTKRGRGSPAPASAGRHAQAASRIALVSVATALLLPVAVPGLAEDAVFTMASGHRADGSTVTTAHPLVSLRRELASPANRQVLEYRTEATQPDYLRTHVLDIFDGENWTMSPLSAERQNRVEDSEELPVPPGNWDLEELVETTVRVDSAVEQMDFLAVPYPGREVQAPGEWYADPETLMVFSIDGHAGGTDYTVRSAESESSPAELARSGYVSEGVEPRYLEVPDSVGDEVHDLTGRLTSGAGSPHERAVALQDWFTGGAFTYSLDPPPVPRGADQLTDFLLETRIGYCEQFAASMAIMARIAGIPSRVAVGYTPGQSVGDGRWVVTETNAHAWPELYFQGHGWLRFEPTPSSTGGQGSASVPGYAQAAPDEQDESGTSANDSEGQSAQEAAEGEDEELAADGQPVDPQLLEDGGTLAAPQGWWTPWRLAAAVAAGLAVLALPMLLRLLIRQLRFTRARDEAALAGAAWAELRDHCRDLALGWDPAQSPRAAARAIAAKHKLPKAARQALRRIALAEERARYAPAPSSEPRLFRDTRTLCAALTAACRPAARLKARLLPRSLWLLLAARVLDIIRWGSTDRSDRVAYGGGA